MKRDLYQEVTDKIVAAIENNPGDVVLPWNRAGAHALPTNAKTGATYQGVNILNLWIEAQHRGFTSNEWATYKQWADKGCQVRKGEKSSLVIFYKQLEWEDDDGEKHKRPMIRASFAFNADQVDGYEHEKPPGEPIDRVKVADTHVNALGASIRHGGAQACYIPSLDVIHMPDEERFFDTDTSTRTEAYYSTLFHELTHWSGAKKRLDRDLSGRFGDEAYAMEELVAELSAAFQCAHLGITLEPRLDHAQYINNWLSVLKSDKKAIFSAAAKAQEATSFLLQFKEKSAAA